MAEHWPRTQKDLGPTPSSRVQAVGGALRSRHSLSPLLWGQPPSAQLLDEPQARGSPFQKVFPGQAGGLLQLCLVILTPGDGA